MSEQSDPREVLAAHGLDAESITRVLDLRAHELAEKIRQEVADFLAPGWGLGGDPKSLWVGGLQDAADLIDPEVTP